MYFANDLNKAFKAIEKKSMYSLLMFAMSKSEVSKFSFVMGASFRSWIDLKRALEEHFEIKISERLQFRELMNLTRTSGETLFAYYNKLLNKCFEYQTFMSSTFDDKTLVENRLNSAEQYILDSFLLEVSDNLRPHIRQKNPKTFKEAYRILRELEVSTGCIGAGNDTDMKFTQA